MLRYSPGAFLVSIPVGSVIGWAGLSHTFEVCSGDQHQIYRRYKNIDIETLLAMVADLERLVFELTLRGMVIYHCIKMLQIVTTGP